MDLALISEYLETYQGRDKFLRTLSYAAKLATAFTSSEQLAHKFKIFGSEMSGCRVILRLLDDIPALHYAMSHNWGKKEPDLVIRWTEYIQILVDIVYCPIEHISWAGERNLITINTAAWDQTTTWFWILSLYLALLKSLRKLKQLENCQIESEKSHINTGAVSKLVNIDRRNELLTCIRMLLDLSYAISYLPKGILWGGRFKTWQVGALGTVSSLIGLYQALSKRITKKKKQ